MNPHVLVSDYLTVAASQQFFDAGTDDGYVRKKLNFGCMRKKLASTYSMNGQIFYTAKDGG